MLFKISQYNEQKASQDQDFIQDMFKTSLAFQVLRIQGFDVSPSKNPLLFIYLVCVLNKKS